MNLRDVLIAAQRSNNSWLCVGIDPVLERLPDAALRSDEPLLAFSQAILEATADLVCAYKPNLAFWLAEGPSGLLALQEFIRRVPEGIPVILDAKFGDVGHTASTYARAAFDTLGADAVTVNPYLGEDAIRPFLEEETHGIFLLARTSNRSATALQDLRGPDGRQLFENVALLATRWDANSQGTCGLVVGATYPRELARVRELAPRLPFLIPGVGAQGGNLDAAIPYGPTSDGVGPVINSSRGIIYASSGSHFAAAARESALHLRDSINETRENAP